MTIRDTAINDAQDMGDILLDAHAKLGQILSNIKPIIESSGRGTIEKKKYLPNGIDRKTSHYAQRLAKHQDIVEEVKQRAREQGEIPTTSHKTNIKQVNKNENHSHYQPKRRIGKDYHHRQPGGLPCTDGEEDLID